MKVRFLSLLFILLVFGLHGCMSLIPEHETKTKAEYYADKKECDKEARVYAEPMHNALRDGSRINEEEQYSRRCLKKKGWGYFLGKSE